MTARLRSVKAGRIRDASWDFILDAHAPIRQGSRESPSGPVPSPGKDIGNSPERANAFLPIIATA
ncbi:MAG: hypothetical protein C6P37_10655 [Caldibacillus debilis]|uniref:Uncharacterized protein n=1 Tax=Caldibacillus debilis TaxID=301148 RepID=A0A150MC33_9BACI|nr:hypothetical protein B4135_1492 [Caldibacillus debilis]MBO2482275.1 hypothetical protein [Bacillaceae bacterium]OUM90147.1 MAG: hypothetical protein BAA03_14650 [Caldibacillus debilis]REJ17173.1 MAG: hypothetical protein C6W57_06290 [Caldibacillus debilis]REJ27570.1 MAG: hypothetical protein C6P37_10655 [Caldibacillus debilis]